MVESPAEGLRVIRVYGPLGRTAAASLLRLVDAQLELRAARHRVISHVVVDLEGVSSFEPGGLETLRHARHRAGACGVGVHLTGCSARSALLPLRTRRLLLEFNTFPTTEVALTALTSPETTPSARPAGELDAEPVPDPQGWPVDGPGGSGPPDWDGPTTAPPRSGLPAPRSTRRAKPAH